MKWLLLGCLLCTGCLPVVQHGPWVRHGYSGALGGSGALVANFEDGPDFGAFINFEGGLRAGFTAHDSSYKGASLGVQLPLVAFLDIDDTDDDLGFLRFINIDGYFTGPEVGNGLITAAGATVSNYHFMPYVQLGHYDDWYATLAVSLPRESDLFIVAPSYTSVRRAGTHTVSQATITVGAGQGEGESLFFIAGVSIIFEFHRKNARTGS
ncbi:MAG TPA: hypothetical protein VFO52_05790 [Longimicrobiales bacterium]|nr:hypothetical protein [Longimicrobiales bacterium]